jgi:hypothetical protein
MSKAIEITAIMAVLAVSLYFLGAILIGNSGFVFEGNDFLSSSLASVGQALNSKSGILGVFEKDGSYSRSIVHSGKSGDIRNIVASPKNGSLIFASSNKGLLASNDGGENWNAFSDVENKIDSGTDVYQVGFSDGGTGFISVYKGGKGIFYSSQDNFMTVEKLFETNGEKITAFALAGDSVYFGLSGGKIFLYSLSQKASRLVSSLPSSAKSLQSGRYDSGLLYASLDSGGFWVSRNSGASFQKMGYLEKYRGAEKISQFFVSSRNDNLIFAATEYGLIKSVDGGKTWRVFDSLPSEENKISSVYYDFFSSEVYASSNGKVYVREEGSLNWKIWNAGSNRSISFIFPYGGKILIGTED